MIYFVQSGTSGPIKIGYTRKSIESRLTTLQTGHPEKLICLGTVEGDLKKEKEIHIRFQKFRKQGEWFEPADSILSYIQESKTHKINKESLSPETREKLEHSELFFEHLLLKNLEKINESIKFLDHGWKVGSPPRGLEAHAMHLVEKLGPKLDEGFDKIETAIRDGIRELCDALNGRKNEKEG